MKEKGSLFIAFFIIFVFWIIDSIIGSDFAIMALAGFVFGMEFGKLRIRKLKGEE